jgi:hypothetical protein
MGRPNLLVVDVVAVQTELDALRDDWITAKSAALTSHGGPHEWSDVRDAAEKAWADAYPALELLRDEIR